MPSPFSLKAFLDRHVVPLLAGPPAAELYSELHRGDPPEEVCVWLRAKDPLTWPALARRLLETPGWSFDYLREHALVQVNGQTCTIFGGDGSPFFNKAGMAMVRLYRKVEPEEEPKTKGKRTRGGSCAHENPIGLIVDVGGKYDNVKEASTAVKAFFGLFDKKNPLEVCSEHRPAFGA